MKEIERLVRASIIIILDIMLISVLISLVFLDNLINEVLYDYGLVFSLNWAVPYWTIMRTSMALIVIVALIFSILELLYPLLRKES